MKQTSAGVIIINSNNQILGCRAYGKNGQCDIPKGKVEDGETPYEAAIRETNEETGLDLSNIHLEEIGLLPYNKKKNIHLFKCNMDIDDLTILNCTSYFDQSGRMYPEMEGFEWVDIDSEKISNKFYLSLAYLLNNILIKK